MMEIHYYPQDAPKMDGEYLAISGRRWSGRIKAIYGITNMNYVADKDGGWNCLRKSDGVIINDCRINNVVAWAELNDIKKEVMNHDQLG